MNKPFYGYTLMVYSFAVCFLAASFFLHARGVFFPYWMEEFSVAKTELSAVVTATLFAGNLFAPVMGYLIDRFPLRIIICAAAGFMACGYLLMQRVDSILLLLLVLIPFQGLAWTGVGPLVHTKLMVNWFSRHRGMALGIAIMGISVAGVIVPPINAYLAATVGWQNAYLVFAGALLLLVIPATLVLVRQHPSDIGQGVDGDAPQSNPAPPSAEASAATDRETPHSAAAGSVFSAYREFLTSKAFWSVVLTFGLMNGVYSAMATHLPTYMSTELDYTVSDAAWLLSVAGGFAIGGKVVFGWMMDHLPAKVSVMVGVTAYIGSTIALLAADSYVWLVLAAALFGLGFGGMIPVRSVVISRIFGAAKFSRANGTLSFLIAPATLWVFITGWIADVAGTYTLAFQIWSGAFALAGLVSLVVRLPDREDAVT